MSVSMSFVRFACVLSWVEILINLGPLSLLLSVLGWLAAPSPCPLKFLPVPKTHLGQPSAHGLVRRLENTLTDICLFR